MATTPDDILDAALKLPESDRLRIASRLLDTLPADFPGIGEEDDGFLDELGRRADDTEPTIPLAELWKQD